MTTENDTESSANKTWWYKYWFVLGNNFHAHLWATALTEITHLTHKSYTWALYFFFSPFLVPQCVDSQDKDSHIKDFGLKKEKEKSVGSRVIQFWNRTRSDKLRYLAAIWGILCLILSLEDRGAVKHSSDPQN